MTTADPMAHQSKNPSTANGLTITPAAVEAAAKILHGQFMTTGDQIEAEFAALAALAAALPHLQHDEPEVERCYTYLCAEPGHPVAEPCQPIV